MILQRPRVLILDEFTASIDPDLAAEIRVNLARCLLGSLWWRLVMNAIVVVRLLCWIAAGL
ncbi:transport ATP-binding protein CydC [Cutibacterium acnes JCM 18909]|nr:transport ATP-binding protein CydC [Cutibacterium acnes JCM 18909]